MSPNVIQRSQSHRRRLATAGVWCVTFNGATQSQIDCGSDASLDDLPAAGHFTAEAWVRFHAYALGAIAAKEANYATNMWVLYLNTNYKVTLLLRLATDSIIPTGTGVVSLHTWTHAVAYYNDTTKTGRVAVDGAWGTPDTGAGAYGTEASANFHLGQRTQASAWVLQGDIAWARLSNNDRYDGANGTPFTPPPRTVYPAVDANTVEQWNLDEAGGALAAAQVSANNNGTVDTACRWNYG